MYHRIIVKVGTTNLTNGKEALDKKYLKNFTNAVAKLHKIGKEILVVTSGAMGASRQFLKIKFTKKKGTSSRQMLAAVGQVYLMKNYWELFQKHNIVIAQALLIREDFNNRQRYLNLRNTLLRLLSENVIPIINENDVVFTEELEGANFGDNDSLSALLATAVDADLLVLLSDIDGLHTANPKSNPEAKFISVVKNIDLSVEKMIDEDKQKMFGWGGMTSKIKAAKIATSHGTEMVIANGNLPEIILDIVEKKEKKSTRFLPQPEKMKNRKKWLTTCVICGKAKIYIDANAENALSQQRSLLPIGIVKTEGKAERGDAVEIYSETNKLIAKGLLEYSLSDINKIKKYHSDEIENILGYSFGEEAVHKDNLVLIET